MKKHPHRPGLGLDPSLGQLRCQASQRNRPRGDPLAQPFSAVSRERRPCSRGLPMSAYRLRAEGRTPRFRPWLRPLPGMQPECRLSSMTPWAEPAPKRWLGSGRGGTSPGSLIHCGWHTNYADVGRVLCRRPPLLMFNWSGRRLLPPRKSYRAINITGPDPSLKLRGRNLRRCRILGIYISIRTGKILLLLLTDSGNGRS